MTRQAIDLLYVQPGHVAAELRAGVVVITCGSEHELQLTRPAADAVCEALLLLHRLPPIAEIHEGLREIWRLRAELNTTRQQLHRAQQQLGPLPPELRDVAGKLPKAGR